MFEKYTDPARRVVVLAQEEARNLHNNYIGAEHLLLGLFRQGDSVADKALETLGITPEAVRQQVEEINGRGPEEPSGHIPFTAMAKRVLDLANSEVSQLSHEHVGPEHILLGLIRQQDSVACQILVKL